MKQEIGNFASTSGAFGPAGPIHLGRSGAKAGSRDGARPVRRILKNGAEQASRFSYASPKVKERGREPSSELGTKCMIYTIRISALKGSIHGQTIFRRHYRHFPQSLLCGDGPLTPAAAQH